MLATENEKSFDLHKNSVTEEKEEERTQAQIGRQLRFALRVPFQYKLCDCSTSTFSKSCFYSNPSIANHTNSVN